MGDRSRAARQAVAEFYDQRLVGDAGPLGFRRTTELGKLLSCLPDLESVGILVPGCSRFLDLGCGDGRVNVLMSYLTQVSVGVELDEWTLDEHATLQKHLDELLSSRDLQPVPKNVHLFHGDATDGSVHDLIRREVGVTLSEFDIFYTYLSAHDDFAALIAEHGKPGSTFLVYGMNRIFPCYDGLELIESLSPLGGMLAVYRKSQDPVAQLQ